VTATHRPTGAFEWAVGIEDTFVGHPSGRRGRVLDEYELIDHYRRWRTDLDLVASLGVRSMRYGIPWYRVNPAPGAWDWSWTDRVLEHLDRIGIAPIVDLVHYGTPLWMERSFVSADYPRRVAEYAAAAAERYRGVAGGWTPLNEPLVNAVFSGRRGSWPPHLRGDAGYDRVLVSIAEGVQATIAALRDVAPDARIVAVEVGGVSTTAEPELEPAVARWWRDLFLPIDLVLGRVDHAHPLFRRLVASGIAEERLARLAATPQRPDLLGVNFYPTMSRGRYVTFRGTVRRRRLRGTAADLVAALSAFHRHTGLPVMVTETSDVADVAGRSRWMADSTEAVLAAREAGLPVVGYTWFPVFSLVDWRWRRGRHDRAAYWIHMGLWDLDEELRRHPTPLVDQYAELVAATDDAEAVA